MSLITSIAQAISETTGISFQPRPAAAVSGGCINTAFTLADAKRCFFVKTNDADKRAMFEAEAAGLQEIARSHSLRAPAVLCSGVTSEAAYLVLEYIDLHSGNKRSARQLGLQLAAMHRTTAARFGWQRDNTIGSTPQINTWADNWASFYTRHRIHYQLSLDGNRNANLANLGARLMPHIGDFFSDYHPQPALLHGDLWGGNWGMTGDAQPVIFDPAVYYGDREADLAMTELFGGFPPDFYAAYNDAFALDVGYKVRKQLYNLYHILNHHHLFGGTYADQAQRMMQQLLAEVGH